MKRTRKSWIPSRSLILRLAAGLLLFLLAGPPLINLALRTPRAHRALLARLEASFGRPVDVGNFSVSLLGGLRVEANFVTVAEDARFGNEFFLRAEQITASLRWSALLRGRLEFGNLALLRPSLNLVRDARGNWNLLAWLPPAGLAPSPPGPTVAAPRLYRISVDAGRVNLKQGEDKHPFALVDVNGNFSQASSGNWQMDFRAQAFRAGSMTQEPGELRVRGAIGGPHSRILPADLLVTWDRASIADVLRLVRGNDFGLRGTLAAEVRIQAASAAPDAPLEWIFKGSSRLEALHGWQLPPRPADPALNLQFDAAWRPASARVAVRQALLESAHSSIIGEGEIAAGPDASSSFRLRSAGIHLGDAFAFYRAFHEAVSAGAELEGAAGLDAEMQGWPLRLTSLHMLVPEGRLHVPGLESSLAFQRASLQFNPRNQQLEFAPLTITLPANVPEPARRLVFIPAEFWLEATIRTNEAWTGEWKLTGQSRAASTVRAVGAALGLYSVRAWQSAGWELEGPLNIALAWQTRFFPFRAKASGTIVSRQATLRSPFLREPVSCGIFRIEFGGPLRIVLTDAQALGGRWTGTLLAVAPRQWDMALRTLRLNVAEFDAALALRDDPNAHGLGAVLVPASAEIQASRLQGRILLNPQLSSPFLQPLHPADLSLALQLETIPRRVFRLTGTLAAPVIDRQPVIAQP